MPVSAKAITPLVPTAQYEPGKGSKGHRNQKQFFHIRKNPAHNIKHRKYCKKTKKENINEPEQHNTLWKYK